jgi:hypothetical protein
MLRAFLLGFSASIALTLAAGAAEAKAPPCKDAKGRVVPCPQKHEPAPRPTGGGGGCMWLLVNGSLVPCYAI